MFKKIALTTVFLGVVATMTVNCSKDACQTYADDLTAKFSMCSSTTATSSTSSTTGTTQTCTSALATKANCLDACLSSFDCCFLTNPADATCMMKEMTYTTCEGKC